MRSIPERGLRSIKTLSNTNRRVNASDGILLKLLSLEREKFRRMKERINLETRRQQNNERLRDVDEEREKLLQLVNNRDEENSLLTQGLSPKDAFCSPTKGFTLRY